MSRCTVCNWTAHDVSVHGELCRNGHPLGIVGRYANGSCRACHRAIVAARASEDPTWVMRPRTLRDGLAKRAFPDRLPRGWTMGQINALALAIRDHMRRLRKKPRGREAEPSSVGAGALPLGRQDPAPASP